MAKTIPAPDAQARHEPRQRTRGWYAPGSIIVYYEQPERRHRIGRVEFDGAESPFTVCWRPGWHTTTSKDVANILADADLALEIETELQGQALDQRKAELSDRFRSILDDGRLEKMAQIIDHARLLVASPKGEPGSDRRRRLRDAITTIRRLLPDEIDADRYQAGDERLAKEHQDLLDRIERFRLKPSVRYALPWHRAALELAIAYRIVLRPADPSAWSRSRENPLVCFVERALQWIGVTITRSAILKVLTEGRELGPPLTEAEVQALGLTPDGGGGA